jgi:hypothetical protein
LCSRHATPVPKSPPPLIKTNASGNKYTIVSPRRFDYNETRASIAQNSTA